MTDEVIEKENAAIAQAYKELLKVSYRTLSADDKKLIRSAFDVALDGHKNQRRKSLNTLLTISLVACVADTRIRVFSSINPP